MSALSQSLLELEQAAADEGRRYGCEQLRQRLQAIADEQGALCPSSGERLEDARFRPLPLMTTLGQLTIRARYGYHRSAHRWMFAVQDLGSLPSRQELSPHLQQVLGYTATECGSYKKAEAMAQTWGVKIGATTIRKHVQIWGAQAQRQQELRTQRALDPHTRPEVLREAQVKAPNALKAFSLVIMMDAWKGRERGPDWGLLPATASGERVDWRDLKVAVIYRLDQVVEKPPANFDPATRPRRQILEKFWVATPSGTKPEEFGRQVHAQALRRGMAQARYVFVVSDGAVWIWNIVEDRFVGAIQELDFYHASEHLWDVARDLYPDPVQARQWVEPLLHQLRHGQEEQVLKTLESLSEEARKFERLLSDLVQTEIQYFQTNRNRLHYQNNTDKGFPAGSGAVESLCSQFEDRFKRTGQFWKSQSMGCLQALKVARHNGDWAELCCSATANQADSLSPARSSAPTKN
jgi:hypothetical protein